MEKEVVEERTAKGRDTNDGEGEAVRHCRESYFCNVLLLLSHQNVSSIPMCQKLPNPPGSPLRVRSPRLSVSASR